ncbi:MAG: hypothetical protein Q3997_02915 [Propionibacteriaceae bacterium]|nr:hypothetical protein [Propionibacteriaceae bacterium]
MSAALPSATHGLSPAEPAADLNDPVDVFDVAARLESSGGGDAAAERLGYADVFHQAAENYHLPETLPPPPVTGSGWHGGLWRAAAMLAGVIICLTTLGVAPQPTETFIAGASCWLAVQVIGSMLWWGIGRGQIAAAARSALLALPVLAVPAAAMSLAWKDAVILAWALWGWVAAVSACLNPGRRLAVLCMLGAGVSVAMRFVVTPQFPVLGGSVVIGAGTAAAVLVLLRRGATKTIKPLRVYYPVGWSAAYVALQLLAIWMAYLVLDSSFIAAAIGAIVGTAVSEVVLDLAGYLARVAVMQTSRWTFARGLAAAAGLLGVVLVALGSVGAAWWFALWWGAPVTAELLSCVLLISAISSGVSYALRLGSAPQAAAMAGLSVFLMFLVLLGHRAEHLTVQVAIAVAVVGVAVVIAATRLSSTKAW